MIPAFAELAAWPASYANRRSRIAVCSLTWSRMSVARPRNREWTVVDQLEGFGGTLRGPFLQVNIALGPHLQIDQAVAQPALHAADTLFVIAGQVIRQPQDGDQEHQGAPFVGCQRLKGAVLRLGK